MEREKLGARPNHGEVGEGDEVGEEEAKEAAGMGAGIDGGREGGGREMSSLGSFFSDIVRVLLRWKEGEAGKKEGEGGDTDKAPGCFRGGGEGVFVGGEARGEGERATGRRAKKAGEEE